MNQTPPGIPQRNRDLRLLVLRRRLTRGGLYLLWLAALVIGAVRFNAAHERHPLAPWELLLWLGGGAVIGFCLLRMWVFFTDRPFIGRVTRSGLSHGIRGDEFRLNTAIRLTDEQSGKRRRLRFEQKNGFYLLYHEGVRVCKLPFLAYPLPDPSTLPPADPAPNPAGAADTAGTGSTAGICGGAFCVVCGHINPPGAQRCDCCRHTLLDPADFFGGNA